MRRFFGPSGHVTRIVVESRALERNLTGDPTARTVDDPDELRAEIARVRDNGYAIAIDQLDYGIASISIPIREPRGEVVAAMNSSGYSGTLTRKAMIEDRLPKLRASAAALTQVLRRHPALLHSLRPLGPQVPATASAREGPNRVPPTPRRGAAKGPLRSSGGVAAE